MDGHRNLEREIESLLSAEPSPEFLARVRTRVAEEPEPARWRAPWMLAVATAVVVLIVAVIAWPSRELVPVGSTGPALQVSLQPNLRDASETTEQAKPVEPTSRPRASARVVALTDAPERALEIQLPEVVLGENEVKAYSALVATIRQRRFDVAVPAAPDLDAPIEIKDLPPIEPIEIEPIVKLALLHAEGERP